MKLRSFKALLFAAVVLAVSVPALAQRTFTNEEIAGLITRCMIENAPEDWQTLIFKLEGGAGNAKPVVEHKVVTGAAGASPQDLKPCRDDYVPKAVNTFRENQDEKARRWTGIVLTIQRTGGYSVTFNYPK